MQRHSSLHRNLIRISKYFTSQSFLKKKYKKQSGSFKELFEPLGMAASTSQSDMIKIGKIMEKTIKKTVGEIEGVHLIEPDFECPQCDILFLYKGTVYYREIKCNVNLDTEKSRSICNKLRNFETIIIPENFPHYPVSCKVLNLRYPTSDNFLKNCKKCLSKDIEGYKQFFNIFEEKITQGWWEETLIPTIYNQMIDAKGHMIFKSSHTMKKRKRRVKRIRILNTDSINLVNNDKRVKQSM